MMRTAAIVLTLAVVLGGAWVAAQTVRAGDTVTIAGGEVREGDVYAVAEAIRVDGRLNGDLLAGARRIVVEGQVDGDLFAAGNTIDLLGPSGTPPVSPASGSPSTAPIDGDLLAGTEELLLTENARIAGGIAAVGSLVEIDGTVGNGVRIAAGEVVIRGTVNGDANFIADRVELAPGARITGDLDYRARTPLSPEAAAQVAGAVRYEEPRPDEREEDGASLSVAFWLWQTLAALLAGVVVVALFRGGRAAAGHLHRRGDHARRAARIHRLPARPGGGRRRDGDAHRPADRPRRRPPVRVSPCTRPSSR